MIVRISSGSNCDADSDWDRHRCRQSLSIKGVECHKYGLLICDNCTDRRRTRNKVDLDELRVCVEDLRGEARHRYHFKKEKISRYYSEQVKCQLCESYVSRASCVLYKKSKKCLELRKYNDDDDDD